MRLYRNDDHHRELVSYLTLRRVVGILGVALPLLVASVCAAFDACTGLEDSILSADDLQARLRGVARGSPPIGESNRSRDPAYENAAGFRTDYQPTP